MADVVEATFYIPFQHPLRRTLSTQHNEALCDRIRRGAFRTKTVGIGVGGGFRDAFQRQQIQRLHGAVFHRGDSQRPLFSVGFRDIDAAQRQRLVPVMLQRPDGLEFGRRSAPYFPIYSGRSLALIFRHPFHGQGFAAKRMGQQPLQSFHLAPAAFPCCLYDTGLQPPDISFTFGPVYLVPMWRSVQGRTHGIIHVHLLFLVLKVLQVFS